MITFIDRIRSKIYLRTAHSPAFVSAMKSAGIKWDAEMRAWSLDELQKPYVFSICRKIFDAEPEVPGDLLVDVHIRTEKEIRTIASGIMFAGIELAYARGEKTGAVIKNRAFVINGGFTSGQVGPDWSTVAYAGTEVLVRNVPLKNVKPGYRTTVGPWLVKGLVSPEKLSLSNLRSELERLETQLQIVHECIENSEEMALSSAGLSSSPQI